MAQALGLTPSDVEPEQTKFNQRLVDKLKYCKEVLVSIRSASVNGSGVVGAAGGEDDGTADVGMGLGDAAQTGSMGLNARASRPPLR
jgi:hypothetical protein